MTRTVLNPVAAPANGLAPASSSADARLRERPTNVVAEGIDGVEASSGSPIAAQPMPLQGGKSVGTAVVSTLDALLAQAGAVGPDVGEFGEVDFPIGATRTSLELRFPLAETGRQQLTFVSNAAAQYAGGQGVSAQTVTQPFAQYVSGLSGYGPTSNDIQALVQWVLREAYIEGTQDLRYYAEKVRFYNEQKKAIREQLGLWRKIQSEFAGVKDEDKARTRLDHSVDPAAGGEGGSGSGTPDGGAPVVTSAAQRQQDYPEQNILVAEFVGFAPGTGRTALEDYIIRDPSAQDRLLQAIPYMTAAELRKVLCAVGGQDMKLAGELSGFWSKVIDAMRPDQMLDLAANPVEAQAGFFVFRVDIGSFGRLFGPKVAAMKARVEAEIGQSFGNDLKALAAAWRQHRNGQLIDAERQAHGAADESALAAINALKEAKPDGKITTEEMLNLIRDAAGDHDAQAASVEFDDLAAFVEANSDRLTPGARAAWQSYAQVATEQSAQGNSGIPVTVWNEMIAGIEQLASERAEEDIALVSAAAEEEAAAAEDGTVAGFPPIDNDPSNGSIDGVMLNANPPPYLIPSGEKVGTVAELETAIKNLEEKLNSVGDDAQLANVDLQNMLQKQQQTIQMLSNISKSLHDTAMAVIRKMAA